MDNEISSEVSKAGKSRKKKETDVLEVARQKQLVRLMKRWFASGKGRTQGKLHTLTQVATTSISDALKPDTITNTDNTLAIIEVVTTPEENYTFVDKFFPSLRRALGYALARKEEEPEVADSNP